MEKMCELHIKTAAEKTSGYSPPTARTYFHCLLKDKGLGGSQFIKGELR